MRTRHDVLRQLLAWISEVRPRQRILIAIDGLDGAGKTTLAEELVALGIEASVPCTVGNATPATGHRPLARVSIDGFHHPRARRYSNGRGPQSFYRDSYDYEAFARSVVTPFKDGLPIVPAVWDVDADVPLPHTELDMPQDCILLIDGIFLHRPELRDLWDASVWVDVPFEVSVPRGNQRYPEAYDRDPEVESNRRYVEGQRLYFAQCSPWDLATWQLDNTDLDEPVLRSINPP